MQAWACGRFGFDLGSKDELDTRPAGGAPRSDAGPSGTSGDASLDAAAGPAPNDAGGGGPRDGAGTTPLPGADGSVAPDPDAASSLPDANTPIADSGGAVPVPDAGPDCSGFNCACITDSLVCTDFSTLPSSMNLASSVGTVSRGSNFLRAVTNGGADAFAKAETSLPTRSSGMLYMRFRLRVKSGFSLTLLNIASVGRLQTPDFGMDFNFISGNQFELYTSGDDAVQRAAYTVPRDTWLCFEADVGLNNGSGTARIRIDGQTLLNRSGLDTVPPGGVVYASVGIDFASSGQAASQVDVDDLAIATTPLGPCP